MPLPANGEPAITVTLANRTEEDLVIPAGDRFCWVTVGDREPEPLNLDQVEEVVGADDQVQRMLLNLSMRTVELMLWRTRRPGNVQKV